MEMLWRIVQRISEPIFIDGHELLLSASAGLVVSGTRQHRGAAPRRRLRSPFTTPRRTVEDASPCSIPASGRQASARLEIEADLRQAFANDDLWIALQPIVRSPIATPVRAEALLRWDRNGTASPTPRSSSVLLKRPA